MLSIKEPEINLQLAKQLGLLEEEFERILKILGRVPTYTELGIFSVMWSEHCSYKNSILELKKLPRSGGRLLVGAGEENAGLVDIGDGLAVAFKIESHNHPSAVEPYQGAATGVGGILRDIFTMGARPVAALNSLRFGKIDFNHIDMEETKNDISIPKLGLGNESSHGLGNESKAKDHHIGAETQREMSEKEKDHHGDTETQSENSEKAKDHHRDTETQREDFSNKSIVPLSLSGEKNMPVPGNEKKPEGKVEKQDNEKFPPLRNENSEDKLKYEEKNNFEKVQLQNDSAMTDRSKYLFKNVIKGIGDYGNCFGVPTIGGEIYFEDCYQDNPLVNAMAVGIVKHNETATAMAGGVGNPVFIVGSSTGKDGIHGATFASEEISEESESKRPNVQVGDPFTEKLLLEATLEVIRTGAVIGIQDMGAAGITCSISEMSAKGNCGMEINLDHVPLRDKNMSAYEIMLSESQERMLVVIEKGKEQLVKDIFDKWDLNCSEIGKVIKEDKVKVYYKGKLEAEVPAYELVLGGGAPVYEREKKEPGYLKENRYINYDEINEPDDLNEVLLKLLSSPNITNKNWVYSQYDQEVRTNTVVLPGGDASVIRLKGTNKALSMKIDCNGRYVFLNPYRGGMLAVCESARNVACTGATPLAITNCLNFGNPYNPEVYFQFSEAIRGIGDACNALETPVTGGNVSFYNQSKEYAVFPTPTIGMIGLIEDVDKVMTSYFKNENDIVLVIGKWAEKETQDVRRETRETQEARRETQDGGRGIRIAGFENSGFQIGGSEYLNTIHGMIKGDAPVIDLRYEKRLQELILKLINGSLINSAHDISDGGFAVAMAECCVMNRGREIGCEINFNVEGRKDFQLFAETQSSIIISADIRNLKKIFDMSARLNIDVLQIGETGGTRCKINSGIDLVLREIDNTYYNTIDKIMSE